MKAEIETKLGEIESAEHVRVLLAVESGSRAWGFASPDSDWDVRFIYVRRLDDYLTIRPRRDVIEKMDGDLDFAGWDLPNALCLFQKSNPALIEWLDSPIVYRADEAFLRRIQALVPRVVSLDAGLQHYRSMAASTYRNYFGEDIVQLKKYLYVLRPLLAGLHIEHFNKWPPTLFGSILGQAELEPNVRKGIDALLAAKSETAELGRRARFPVLDSFIEANLERLAGKRLLKQHDQAPIEELDAIFRHFAKG